MSKVPGFRSGTKWKKVVAVIGYLFIFSVVYGMFSGDDVKTTAAPVAVVAETPPPAPVVEKSPEEIAKDKAIYDEAVKKADAAIAANAVQAAADKAIADAKAVEDKKIADAKAIEDKKVADAKAAAAAEAAKPKHIAYKDLARNPDSYMGTNVIFTGQVIQVQESGKLVNLRVNVTKNTYGYEDTVMIQYDKGIVSSRVLEDDIITFSGMSMGLLTYKTVMGSEMTIPQVLATNVSFQ